MGLGYRLLQKVKYHFASDEFQRQTAEINRYREIVSIDGESFKVQSCPCSFSISKHSFILKRIDDFLYLSRRGQFQVEGNYLLYRIDDLSLRVTTAEELFIIQEIFFQTVYYFHTGQEHNVIDIGMNVGFASLFFAKSSSVSHVWSYEPFRKTYEDAEFNISLNPHVASKITSRNVGLGKQAGKVRVRFSDEMKGKNSINASGGSNPSDEEIELVDAHEEIVRIVESKKGEPFIVKMDCEGAEFDIFESLEIERIPSNIVAFVIEWHHRSPASIVAQLIANGFKVHQTGTDAIGILTAMR